MPYARRPIRQDTGNGLLAPPLGRNVNKEYGNGKGGSGEVERQNRGGRERGGGERGFEARRQYHKHGDTEEEGKGSELETAQSFGNRGEEDALGLVLRHALMDDGR